MRCLIFVLCLLAALPGYAQGGVRVAGEHEPLVTALGRLQKLVPKHINQGHPFKVSVSVDAEGYLISVTLVQSSGISVNDLAVFRAIVAAAPYPEFGRAVFTFSGGQQ